MTLEWVIKNSKSHNNTIYQIICIIPVCIMCIIHVCIMCIIHVLYNVYYTCLYNLYYTCLYNVCIIHVVVVNLYYTCLDNLYYTVQYFLTFIFYAYPANRQALSWPILVPSSALVAFAGCSDPLPFHNCFSFDTLEIELKAMNGIYWNL